jgi:hypothetical protein
MATIAKIIPMILTVFIFSLKTAVPIIVPKEITPKFIAAKISVGLLLYA